MAHSKAEFVLVPGAWHGPAAFRPTTILLEKAGYKVHGINLPTVGAEPVLQSFDEDIKVIRNKVNQVLESGNDVVIVSHSYGGVVKSEALADYVHKLEGGYKREAGIGMVMRLVYMTSFVLPEGGTLMSALGGKPLPWFIIENEAVSVENPSHIFYNDCTPEQQKKYVSMLTHHSYPAFASVLTVAPWRIIPSTYIICENDQAIPLVAQEGLITAAQTLEPGCFDVVDRCDAGHSPFISQPEWLAEKLVAAAADPAKGTSLSLRNNQE